MIQTGHVVVALVCAALPWGCGGGGGAREGAQVSPSSGPKAGLALDQAPPARTEAVLVGPLCQGDACRCRAGDENAGSPAAGHKRFEVRMGVSDDPQWVQLDGMLLYKGRDAPEACFYVDLAPGKHAVSLRAEGDEQGMSAALSVAESRAASSTTWWYRTFDFQCGTPDPCDIAALNAWKQEIAPLAGKHDPCGSTKVQEIRWETGRGPDRDHPDGLLLHLTLEVYKFVPPFAPGSKECDAENRAGDDGA